MSFLIAGVISYAPKSSCTLTQTVKICIEFHNLSFLSETQWYTNKDIIVLFQVYMYHGRGNIFCPHWFQINIFVFKSPYNKAPYGQIVEFGTTEDMSIVYTN